MSTMNEKILDEQYQQFKLETSQVQNENFWIEQGINKNLIEKIQSYIQLGKLTSNDIDERVCEQLRTFPNDLTSIQSLFNEFDNSNLTGVVNKSAFLCNLIRQWKIQNPCEDKTSNVNTNSQSIENSNELIETNTEKHQSGPDQNKLKVKIFELYEKSFGFCRKFLIELDIKWILLLVNVNMVDHHLMVLIDQLLILK